jgi:hypothetical protein
MVVEQDWDYPFGFIDKDNNLTLIKTKLKIFGQIESLLFSPSEKKMIIESFGDGRQYLSVYCVADLIDHYDEPTGISPINTLDPYPYELWDIKWINNNCIQFSSYSDFSFFDKKRRRGKYSRHLNDNIKRTWRWNINSDTFIELNLNP